MNRSLSRLFMLLVALMLIASTRAYAQDSGFPRTIYDGAGNKVTINAKPVRIVSASLASDEMLLDAVDSSRLVAITANALDPAQSAIAQDVRVKAIKNTLTKADPEALIALKPDLVFVASYTDPGVIKQLKDAGLPVVVLASPNSIKDIQDNIRLIGQAVGAEEWAVGAVSIMQSQLEVVSNAVKNVQPLTVLYYGPDGYSVGAGTTIDEVITRAGGINAVTAGGIKDNPYPQLGDEFVVKTDPDVILLAGFNSYAPGFIDKFKNNPNFQTLKAVKNGRVVVANDAYVASVSQYITFGVQEVAALLYPNAYMPTPTTLPTPTMLPTATYTPAVTTRR